MGGVRGVENTQESRGLGQLRSADVPKAVKVVAKIPATGKEIVHALVIEKTKEQEEDPTPIPPLHLAHLTPTELQVERI